jgi:hypothetical protein
MDGHLAILDDIGDALKQAFNKVSDGIRDAAAKTSDALNKASDEASKPTRDWLNSDIGKQVQHFAKTVQENLDGLYGLVEKGKDLNTIAGGWMGNKKLPKPFRQVGSWWLRNVAQDKGFKAAKAAVDSPIGKGVKRGLGALSFALDAAENYAHGDKALPALGKAGITASGP